MDLSIIIPTRNRVAALERLIRALDAQTLPIGRFRVIVTVDGPGEAERAAIHAIAPRADVRVVDGPPDGPGAARNRALALAEAQTVLLLNDDVVPAPDLLAAHLEAHAQLGRPAMVLGSAPWRAIEPDRVLDRMVRETSMVFFFDQMTGERARNPDHDWGFRHAWTLNLSMPTEALRAAGGFAPGLRYPVYEDVEMAFRVVGRTGMPVVFRPGCVVTHEHRYELRALIRREALLGHQAVRLAAINAACAQAIFGFLHTDPARTSGARARLAAGADTAVESLSRFAEIATGPADAFDSVEIAGAFEHLWKPARAHLRAMGWVAATEGLSAREAMDHAEQVVAAGAPAHAA
jgi:GT2 family glycosyltransferase